ncbi:hypothetical protein H1R20_g1369, partial [Candolleomyces eurysporus]
MTAAKQLRKLRRKYSAASSARSTSFWLLPELWIYMFHLASSPSHLLSSSILFTPEDLACRVQTDAEGNVGFLASYKLTTGTYMDGFDYHR